MGENIHKKSNQQGIKLQIYNELMQLKVKKKKKTDRPRHYHTKLHRQT